MPKIIVHSLAIASLGCAVAATYASDAIAAPGQAQDWQIIDDRASAMAAAAGRSAQPIDRRIKLAHCPEAVVIEMVDAATLAARCPSLGWRLRIALQPASEPASPSAPATLLVKRGEPVRIRVESGAFVLIYAGIAAENGKLGDVITVRTDRAKTLLSAVVTARGQAILHD